MANTYSQIYMHAIFAVKYREALLDKKWRSQLFKIIGALINEMNAQSIIVNGVEDHVHCLFRLRPAISISSVMKNAKAKSSQWINKSNFLEHRFEWQRGFSAFSYSQSQVEKIKQYIRNQETHHRSASFLEENKEFLKKFNVDFKDEYLFKELI